MRATQLLQRQLASVRDIYQDVAGDLTAAELTTRPLPDVNLFAFDLWHASRTQDFFVQTLIRGVEEVAFAPAWQGRIPTDVGIGVGLSREDADRLAHSLALPDLLAYTDAVHQEIMTWLDSLADSNLDATPDVDRRLEPFPQYRTQAMRDEVPWLAQHPPVWRCMAPALGHVRDHLAEIDLLKRAMRAGHSESAK